MTRKVLKELHKKPISPEIGNCSYFFEPVPFCGSCFTFISNYFNSNIS